MKAVFCALVLLALGWIGPPREPDFRMQMVSFEQRSMYSGFSETNVLRFGTDMSSAFSRDKEELRKLLTAGLPVNPPYKEKREIRIVVDFGNERFLVDTYLGIWHGEQYSKLSNDNDLLLRVLMMKNAPVPPKLTKDENE